MVKLVDTRDLKSLALTSVPVQVRPRAPLIKPKLLRLGFFVAGYFLTFTFCLSNNG
ncbi:hypothetical protein ENHYDAX1_200164 [Enhydrobacter sp. AX1]|nr:hypothetical protein ENHYDAX1_200164 [Enhydrobacter sp. AX1]